MVVLSPFAARAPSLVKGRAHSLDHSARRHERRGGDGQRDARLELLHRRLSVQCQREAIVVVGPFPRAQWLLGLLGRREVMTTPELLVVDAMASFHLPVLLRPPWFDVPVPNPSRLHGKLKGERKLGPVVALQFADRERQRGAQFAKEMQA